MEHPVLPPPPSDEEVAAAAMAARQDARNLPALLHLADRCLHAGEADRAVSLARLAVALAPNSFQAVRALSGVLSVAAGPHGEAITTGLQAVDLSPDDAEARLHAGGLLAADGQWRAACEQLSRYVASPAASAAGWRLLSTALHESGRTREALDAVDQALALAPREAEYRVHRAGLLGARGRYGDALSELRTAAAHAPDDARIWRASSGIHEVLHELPQALLDAERAASLDPGNAAYAEHLAHMQGLLGPATPPGMPAAAGDASGPWTPATSLPHRRRVGSVASSPQFPGTAGWTGGGQRWVLGSAAATQARIVAALVLREMRTRFGRSRLGYLWAVVEPIGHLLTLGSVFSLLNQGAPPAGDSLFLFYLTGLLPFLLFGHVASDLAPALAANAAVLQVPIIKRIDVIVARSLLLLATEIVVGALALAGAALLGAQGMPADPLSAAQAVCLTWLLATGVGTANLVLSELLRSWDVLFAAVNRLLYFASGIYYSPVVMPDEVRRVLAWNPVLHCVEWFRAGFYRQYEPHWLDRVYLLTWAAGALLLGLAAERALRRRMPVLA